MTFIRSTTLVLALSSIAAAPLFAQSNAAPTPPNSSPTASSATPAPNAATPPTGSAQQAAPTPEVQKAVEAFNEAQQKETDAIQRGDTKTAHKWKKKREQTQKQLEDLNVRVTPASPQPVSSADTAKPDATKLQ